MDHTEAVQSNAVERFALGDLPLGQVEDFERHFFECSQCSEELRSLSVLTLNLRAVLSEEATISAPTVVREPVIEKPPPVFSPKAISPKWWRQPLTMGPAFAAFAFAALLVLGSLLLFLRARPSEGPTESMIATAD